MNATLIRSTERDIPIILERKKAAIDFHKRSVEPLRKLFAEIRDLAMDAGKKMKANRLIPSSAGKHAGLVADTADELFMFFKNTSPYAEESLAYFDELIATKERNIKEETDKLSTNIDNLEDALKKVSKEPTVEVWQTGSKSAHQRCRSMCNAIRTIPVLKKKYWSTWQPFGNEYHGDIKAGDPDEEKKMTKKIDNVIKELKDFKKNYEDDLRGG